MLSSNVTNVSRAPIQNVQKCMAGINCALLHFAKDAVGKELSEP